MYLTQICTGYTAVWGPYITAVKLRRGRFMTFYSQRHIKYSPGMRPASGLVKKSGKGIPGQQAETQADSGIN